MQETMTTLPSSPSRHSLNCGGRLFALDAPQVMGILNCTPDSFYAGCRSQSEEELAAHVRQMVAEGATMIDVGGCSTRPGAEDVSAEEEMRRLRMALAVVAREAPGLVVSVDTYRADVAKMAVEELGAHIINDISGGALDAAMFKTVARLGVPYVLTHMQGVPATMQTAPHYDDLLREVFLYFAERVQRLRDFGAKDLVLDPGFGFGKTLEHNYELMGSLEEFAMFDLPLLVGVSRKSMVYRLLECTPDEALNGTTVLHTAALLKGASILRVHDVRPAVEAVRICQRLTSSIH